MPRNALIGALTVIGLSVLLGATVFREEIAQASQAVSAEIVGPLDGQGNVKVHEQGTADVHITNRAVTVTGAVAIDETTSKLLDKSVPVPPGDPGPKVTLGTVDTASLSHVRVAAEADGECSGLVFLRVTMPGPAGDVLVTGLTQGLNTAIDIPGPELTFSLQNLTPGGCTVHVTVWGRSA
jgi:hypothetical protein